MAIGVGYFLLTPAIIVFWYCVLNKTVLKAVDALVQMSRISGEVVGADEISQSLINLRGSHPLRTWGVILITTALGICVASFWVVGASFTDLSYHRCFRHWHATGGPTFVSYWSHRIHRSP